MKTIFFEGLNSVPRAANATWQQVGRIAAYTKDRWQLVSLRRAARSAEYALGGVAFAAGVGDLDTRRRITSLDDQIKESEAKQRPVSHLRKQRNAAYRQLASQILQAAPDELSNSPSMRNVQVIHQTILQREATINDRRSHLFPKTIPERLHVGFGLLTIIGVFVLVGFMLRGSRPEHPVLADDQAPVTQDIASMNSGLPQDALAVKRESPDEREVTEPKSSESVTRVAPPQDPPRPPDDFASSTDSEQRQYLKRLAPAVLDGFSVEQLYRTFPSARDGNKNRNPDGSLEIFWGDNLVQRHVMIDTQRDRVLMSRTRVFGGERSVAQRRANEPRSILGAPSEVTPASDAQHGPEYQLWNTLGYGVRTAVTKGSTVDGVPVYFSEVIVTNQEAISHLPNR